MKKFVLIAPYNTPSDFISICHLRTNYLVQTAIAAGGFNEGNGKVIPLQARCGPEDG